MSYATIRRFALGAVAALALAACQTTLTLNTENLQRLIQTGIQEQNPGVVVSSVTCPERPLQLGDVFNCTATTADGQSLTVEVTQTDAAGNVHWKIQ
jgi:hypothetical protein